MRTLTTGLTANEIRSLVMNAQEILSSDPDRFTANLLGACRKVVDNHDRIIDEALSGGCRGGED